MNLFVSNEDVYSDDRVSLSPDIAKKILELNHHVFIERGAGVRAGYLDSDYEFIGCEIKNRDYSDVDIIFAVNPLPAKDIKCLKSSTIVISPQELFNQSKNLKLFTEYKVTTFALDLIPRTTRAQYMDILSSQANLAGYRAVIEAAHILDRAIPLMMTTAGTIPAAKVLIIGAGVAGLQAIATAKRLGAIVSAFDVRASAKEQVESLGAKFVEVEGNERNDGVYAREMTNSYKKAQESKLRSILPHQDIIITTAQIPGKKAPIILKTDMIDTMKNNSIIIDLASKTGGNCELTKHGEIIEISGVKIIAFENILNLIPHDASRLFSKNIFAFFELLMQKMSENPDLSAIDDEIIKATLVTYDGKVVNDKIGVSKNA
ncbi:MAG: NAD(P) transhydrogenase subunit alpha [Holosporales bacterium]|nr:NAD(P) transhydrogenase subunit alpha [Holosporales bacterium]